MAFQKRLSKAIKNLDKGVEMREKELKPEQYGDLWRVTPNQSRNKYVSIVLKNASVGTIVSIPGGVTHAGSGGSLRVALFWSSNTKTSEPYDTNTQVSRVHLFAQIVV